MSATPPAFQEAACCDVCKCTFSTFRRRHHCRRCGRTLCHEHSSNHMALPQFGIYSSVRVCSDCFNNGYRSTNDVIQTSSDTISDAADALSELDIGEVVRANDQLASEKPIMIVTECKCGMPLCICKAPVPDPAPLQMQSTTISKVQPNRKPKKADSTESSGKSISKKLASSSTSKASPFISFVQSSHGNLEETHTNYDVSGEGLREAIKNGDKSAVKELLTKGVDANYCDKQGLTLLHLAALFNQTEIAFILMEHGASAESKNAQGETPLDCAPAMLQYKMRKKLEECA